MSSRKPSPVELTAQYIAQQIDAGPWQELLRAHSYCRSCPARSGPLPGSADDLPDAVCPLCPLRPLMLALSDLALRQADRAAPESHPAKRRS